MADDREATPEVEAVVDEAVIDEGIMDEMKEDEDEPMVVSSNQSETLKAIVDFEEEDSDMNTELFKSTIRTTPLDSKKDKIDVDQLLNSDEPGAKENNVKSEEAKAKKKVEKEALKAAKDSADEEEEELDVYQGIEEKKENEWTIVRCTSDDNSVEDIVEGEEKSESKMEENSVDEVRDDTDEDKSFEIIDEKEVEDCKDDDCDDVTEIEKDSESKPDGDEAVIEAGIGDVEEDKTRTSEDAKDQNGDILYEVTGVNMDKANAENNSDDVKATKMDLAESEEESVSDKSAPTSPTEGDVEMDQGDKEKDEEDGKTEDAMEADESKTQDDSETADDSNRKSLSEFDDIQVTGVLDTHVQKSRARLAKTGALAQRRKPPRSSWYVEDGQKIQEFMFTDSTEPKPLKQVKEEESPVPSPRTPPKVATRKPPPGAMASPLLLPGLGANFKLKKTAQPDPSKPSKSHVETKSPAGLKSPPAAKFSPSQILGKRVLPIPAKRQPAHSKGKAPSPPEGKATVEPIKPQQKQSEEKVISPKEASPSSTIPQARPPPSPAAKPTVKPRPKPLPKPRPQSMVDPSAQKDTKVSRTSRDDLNSDILNGQKSPVSPRWIADKNKKLPPISPNLKTATETSDPFQTPKWKQDLIKKRKDAEAAGLRKSLVPPSLPKKEDPSKAPSTTLPQWQLELAKKKKMRKAKDEESQEDDVSRHPKEPKTEDSNKMEQEKRTKPLLSPKPAIVPRKKFEAVPPGKDPIPSWQKNLQDKKKNNEKNLLIENGEKKDIEKPAVISPPSKKDNPFISSSSYNSKVPHWKLELEQKNAKLFQRFHNNDME